MRYRFQSFLTLTVNSNGRRQYDRYFRNEYRRIDETASDETTSACDVTLEIVDHLPDDLPRDTIHQVRRFKNLFTFEFAIVGAGTRDARIYFKDHPVSRLYVTAVGVFVQAQVLEPVMYWSLLNERVLLMHCAGVAKDGCAILFPAEGGTGKTTTSMALLPRGYDFLGDDLILVDPEAGLAHPYPRPLHIFTYNVRNLNNARIPVSISAAVYAKNVLRFFLERVFRTEFLISTRVHADEILDDFRFAEPARLERMIFLIREGDSRSVDIATPEIVREIAETVVTAADLNESLFDLVANPETEALIRSLEIDVASRIVETIDYFGFLNTRRIDLAEIEMYLDRVDAFAPYPRTPEGVVKC